MATIIVPAYSHVSSDNGAKKIACEAYVKEYDAKTATVTQMHNYAECVNTLHPADMAGGKFIVASLLIGVVLGGVFGWTSDRFNYGDQVAGAVVGGLSGALFVGVCWLFFVAIEYLLK